MKLSDSLGRGWIGTLSRYDGRALESDPNKGVVSFRIIAA